MSRSHNSHVLIIGGGLAGVCVATTLAKATAKTGVRITIIEPKDYVQLHWAAIRAMFDAAIAESALIPLAPGLQAYPTVTHVRARVKSLTRDAATLDDGQVLRFDACLVATGASAAYAPLRATADDRPARLRDLAAAGAALRAAPSALVIGGGLVGAELAGDIAVYASADGDARSVTLVHSRDTLAPPLTASSSDKLRKKLAAAGVTVVTGQHAEQRGDGWFAKESGDALRGDTVVPAVGVAPGGGGELLRGVVGERGVDARGWVCSDRFGRVVDGGGMIFALGDCVKGDFKSGVNIMGSKEVMAGNIAAVLDAVREGSTVEKAGEKMKEFPAPMEMIGVTVGPYDGIMQTPWLTDTRILPLFKNKTMFTSRGKSQMGI